MRVSRLLRLCVMAALLLYSVAAFIGATPSFVRLPTPILIPSSYASLGANVLTGWTTTNMSADTHRVAVVFKVPARGNTPDTITLFGAYVRVEITIPATDSNVTCTLYNVKDGKPELGPGVPGKPYHPSGSGGPHGGSAKSPGTVSMLYVSFGTAAVCTAGQTIAALFSRVGGSNATITTSRTLASTNAASQIFPYCATRTSVSWVRQTAVPAFGLRWSDYSTRGSYLDAGIPVDSINSTTYIDSATTPDEIGNRVLFPFPMKVIGAWSVITTNTGVFKGEIALYDTTGTNGTKVAAATFNDTINSTAETSVRYYYWGHEITMNANQTYRLVWRPTDMTDMIAYRYTFLDSTSMMYGPRIHATQRSADGAWSDYPKSVIPHMGFIVSQLSAGQEGGAMGRRRRILGSELDTVFLGMTELERTR